MPGYRRAHITAAGLCYRGYRQRYYLRLRDSIDCCFPLASATQDTDNNPIRNWGCAGMISCYKADPLASMREHYFPNPRSTMFSMKSVPA